MYNHNGDTADHIYILYGQTNFAIAGIVVYVRGCSLFVITA